MKRVGLFIVPFLLCYSAGAELTTRYFSTSSNGDGDGTSWENRAALFDESGNWSAVITGFDFSGTDGLMCLIGPGSYSCSQSLVSGLFSNAPTLVNPLILQGCDGTGEVLTLDNPSWSSAQPVDWDENLPVIATSTNVQTVNLGVCGIRLVKFTATNAASPVVAANWIDWCVIEQGSSSTSADGLGGATVTNCSVVMSGSQYRYGAGVSRLVVNTRVEGNADASGGSRVGLNFTNSTTFRAIDRCTVFNHPSTGVLVAAVSGSGQPISVFRTTVVGSGGNQIAVASGGSVGLVYIHRCMITGGGGAGITGGDGIVVALDNRIRDNSGADFASMGNYPVGNNVILEGEDASEYVDADNGDYRIKTTSDLWGVGYGAGDEPAVSGYPLLDHAYVSEEVADVGDGNPGTLKLPTAGQVQDGVLFGVGGDGSEGTLELTEVVISETSRNALINGLLSTSLSGYSTEDTVGKALVDAGAGGNAPTAEEIRTEMDSNSTQFAAIRERTDRLPDDPFDPSADGVNVTEVAGSAVASVDDFKADVSSLATVGDFVDAVEDEGTKLHDLWSMTEVDGTRVFTSDALSRAPSGSGATAQEVWEYGTRTITGGTIDTVDDKTGYSLTGDYDAAKTAATQASVDDIDSAMDAIALEVTAILADTGTTLDQKVDLLTEMMTKVKAATYDSTDSDGESVITLSDGTTQEINADGVRGKRVTIEPGD